MSLQIIHGGNGKPTGVFIPINDWESMKNEYKNLQLCFIIHNNTNKTITIVETRRHELVVAAAAAAAGLSS